MLTRLVNHLIWIFKGVQVYGLVGKSGTGKSFRAELVADKYNIEMIIDDGLLIKDQKILAGKTAKRAKGILAAIGTALFASNEHAMQVRQALYQEKFKRILLIGTSEKMVRKIAHRLLLPNPHKIVLIEDVATKEEIDAATRDRNSTGKHIIPVPAIEVKRTYPQIFFDSVKIFFKRRFHLVRKGHFIEKTLVRPDYSDRGRISISEAALTQMVLHCVQEFNPALGLDKVVVSKDFQEYSLEVILKVPFGEQVAAPLYELQSYIINHVERFTGMIINEVNITIGKVTKADG